MISTMGREADDFLAYYRNAQTEMRKACDAMKAVSLVAATPELRKHYDTHHKAMVRAMRAWNELEHKREAYGPIGETDT